MSDTSLSLRSVRTQVQHLCHGLRALEGKSASVLAHAEGMQDELKEWKARYPSLAVIFSPKSYRIFTTSVALEVWERLSHFNAHIDIASLRHGHTGYVPAQFQRIERTKQAIKQLQEKQADGPLLVVPVRIERIDPSRLEERTLLPNEFDFGLAATLAVLASHARVWEMEQREVLFAGLGERFGSSREFAAVNEGRATPSVPVAGIRHHERVVAARHLPELRNHYVITGLVA